MFTKRQTRAFFYGGSGLCALLFLGMTVDTHRQVPKLTNEANNTPEVIAGKHVWHRKDCINCHTLLGEGAYYGPDLTKITQQRGSAYLTAFLKDPAKFYSEERDRRLMPNQKLTDLEIQQLIAFLDWVSKIDTQGWPPRPILVSGSTIPGAAGVGAAPAGACIAVASSVPIGAGLSSSAALTVAGARTLGALAGRRLDAPTLVDVASRAEHEQVGVRGGRMDQTIAVYGKRGTALLFETGSGRLSRVPLPGRVWLIETGVSHKLTGGELNERRRECEAALLVLQRRWPDLRFLAGLPVSDLPVAERLLDAPLARRVRHVVTETARVYAAVDVLRAGNLPRLGSLLVEGHESLRAEYQSSCPEADFLVESAVRHGAHGARLTGAGWGGAVLMLAPEDRERAVVQGVRRDFADRFGRVPVAWATRAAGGARRDAIRD